MIKDYTSFGTSLRVLSEKLPLLPKIDALVFDIDGVVLDVTGSFRVVIGKTVQFYFSEILKWSGDAALITPEETQLFKLAGGFNNDWELTYAAVLFYLSRAEHINSRDLSTLRDPVGLAEFTSVLREKGSGLEAATSLALDSLDPEERSSVLAHWDKKLIQKIFQEFYGGSDHCRELYGFDPSYVQEKGLIGQEKLLLETELVRPWYPKIGVVTGRTRKEAEVALRISGLEDLVLSEHLVVDEGEFPRKPDPMVLKVLVGRMHNTLGVYFGDTPDDLSTVENYQRLGIPSSFISCIIIHRESEKELYVARNTDILAKSANEVLVFLNERKEF
jgi:HAD superfamily hydrolase (TIGR01548 family)